MRLGRETEASALLEKVVFLSCGKFHKSLQFKVLASSPVDEGALNAMTIAFRELQVIELFSGFLLIAGCQEPGKICRMYEGAVAKEPNNEEFLTHLFMSYVRLVMIVWFVFTHLFAGWESTKSKKRQPEIFTK